MSGESEKGFAPPKYDHRPAYMIEKFSRFRRNMSLNGKTSAQIVRNAIIRFGDQIGMTQPSYQAHVYRYSI